MDSKIYEYKQSISLEHDAKIDEYGHHPYEEDGCQCPYGVRVVTLELPDGKILPSWVDGRFKPKVIEELIHDIIV